MKETINEQNVIDDNIKNELDFSISNTKSRGLFQDAVRKLLKNKVASFALIFLFIILVLAIFLPYFLPYSLEHIDWDVKFPSAPNFEDKHYLGTDSSGRDLLVRILYGTRISFLVGLSASLVSLIIGVTYGSTSGFLGGMTDSIMMRVVDILYSLPFMFFVIILMVVFGRNIFLLFVALGAVEWLTMARIVRGQTLSIKSKTFIEAARITGSSNFKIIKNHIIPNTISTVIVYLTLTIPQVILIESFLSFLGLGVQEPLTSLGILISDGARNMEVSWWLLVFPGFVLASMLFCFNFIGDGLRDALDPKDNH